MTGPSSGDGTDTRPDAVEPQAPGSAEDPGAGDAAAARSTEEPRTPGSTEVPDAGEAAARGSVEGPGGDRRPTAVVTGAARGIGAAIARLAAERGYRVGVLDVDGDGARALAADLPGAEALVTATDDEAGVLAALDAFADATGRAAPDLVVCNAGIVRFGPLADLSLEDWRRVVDVNLTGTFVVARAAATRMAAVGEGGAIVALTSINGVAPGPNAGAYGATKAAVALLMSQLAIEFGPAGVRANAVAPGLIDGGMSGPIYADEAVRAARSQRVPLGRLGTEDDVARVVLFLGSDEAAYVSGQEIVVDGGVVRSIIAALPRPQAVDRVGR